MIEQCSECKGNVSNQAATCPHCGHPVSKPSTVTAPKDRRVSLFLILALCGFVVSLFTPRLIVSLPIFGTIACAVISLFRRERAPVLPVLVLVAAIGILMLNSSVSSGLSGSDPSALRAVEIVNWNWRTDPHFGGKGTILWNAQVRNNSDKYIESVRLELTTYDASNKLVTTAFTFVEAIPPGGDESYATYYGTEERAGVQVASVRFSRE